ncbi:putative dihydrodipicolinate synthase [Tetragenococcus halophilus subsp. halophilus]|uniref:Dihydrodipicolinate synthase n=1 Tax=Tetragenococcus halophilus (strain DSM 20338 / JCM 20259 / NCIMB 9735 / NBRC 12172) TaxID=945021 RepID=A0AAN1VQC5_TETHN|nr:dihydrodipicolinate synthase family protein [Tetragenococcus halophilus]AOF48373.1 dihydrodipicolinate synthase [Tetragenococcus halophilus]MCO7027420.1 dihydrodipicolinate synthase family protein [Tetragenococcus halophilus]MCO8284413.1 dihydrodipicolinate synthase family protein [Tetragenococcus halophilus]MCO8287468.1 dihydrodipicolinate synthase family protein [Tetragenococcus halophilus]NWO01101.1 dihydrodipicolinate synthase family protein [Tetragenococcus halophilus]
MNTDNLKGIIVPLITPITNEEEIDEEKLKFIVEHVIENGVHGILIFGSNGEFFMFNEKEMKKVIEIVLEQTNHRVPVYFGIGEIRTKKCIELAKMAEELNVDGISILQPMFIDPTSEELYQHFKSIASTVPEIPVLLYNNPGKTGYTISADLVSKLARDVTNIVGIKDSSGDFTQLFEFIRQTKDLDFKTFAGKDTLVYPALCVGAAGAVCSTSNMLGELVNGIYDKYEKGDYTGALENQLILNPIRLSQNEATFPAATKDMANIMDLNMGNPVLPVTSSKGQLRKKMESELSKAGFVR